MGAAGHVPDLRAVEPDAAPDLLARHVFEATRRALSNVGEVEDQLALTNRVLAFLARDRPAEVYQCKEHRCDLFFVTLDKDEKDFTPTTLYHDYVVSPTLFHWQSQSVTREDSDTGRRYREPPDGWRLLLFVRRSKRDDRGVTRPFLFLGPVRRLARGRAPDEHHLAARAPGPGRLVPAGQDRRRLAVRRLAIPVTPAAGTPAAAPPRRSRGTPRATAPSAARPRPLRVPPPRPGRVRLTPAHDVGHFTVEAY